MALFGGVLNKYQMSKELPINSENQEKLDIIRHDCAHVLAEAVQSLFPNLSLIHI